MDVKLKENSVDVFIASHTIHHFYHLKNFSIIFKNFKTRWALIIQEINTSLLIRFLLRLMKHEGWNYDVNVFDENEILNNPNDLWSANCAIPEMLFEDEGKFKKNFPFLRL